VVDNTELLTRSCGGPWLVSPHQLLAREVPDSLDEAGEAGPDRAPMSFDRIVGLMMVTIKEG
jgi:hypothetical protein